VSGSCMLILVRSCRTCLRSMFPFTFGSSTDSSTYLLIESSLLLRIHLLIPTDPRPDGAENHPQKPVITIFPSAGKHKNTRKRKIIHPAIPTVIAGRQNRGAFFSLANSKSEDSTLKGRTTKRTNLRMSTQSCEVIR